MQRLILILFTLLLCPDAAFAGRMVLRDSIDGSVFGNYIGGATNHEDDHWSTPGMVMDVPVYSQLTQVQVLIFARDELFLPENDLADIYGYPMEFHIWSDGTEGGDDSFAENGRGDESIPGHLSIDVNSPNSSYITVEEHGTVGPADSPKLFKTFLVTVDLSSFEIVLNGGQEYVVGVIQDNKENFLNGGGIFRQTASFYTGPEDMFQTDEQPSILLPGYLNSQLGFGADQWAGTITVANGDFNGDGRIDGFDFLKWQRDLGQDISTAGTGADVNGNGTVDRGDLRVWELTSGYPSLGIAVPEPATDGLFLLACSSVAVVRPRKSQRVAS